MRLGHGQREIVFDFSFLVMCVFTSKKIFALEKVVEANQKLVSFEQFVGVKMLTLFEVFSHGANF